MAHVTLKYSSGKAVLHVDGIDISRSVMHDGFGIEFPDQHSPAVVSMRLIVNALEVDLPDAILSVVQNEVHDDV